MYLRFSTPGSRKLLLTFGITLIAVQPAFTLIHYIWNETVKPDPWYADSAGIPVFSELFVWLLLAPLAILTNVRLSRHYHSGVPLLRKQTLGRRFVGINIIFGLLITYASLQMIDVFLHANLPMLIDVILSLYLLLAVRAVVIENWFQAQSSDKLSSPLQAKDI